ncbi:hypothetical protein MKW94_013904 [Papaver nudicaule]|uniref:Uncharacterized protein n=1 Tax=Papaver nudicaule TaxID=74823 RepID=A0AA41SA20_PAPNU|nr:hypothetical protein [Papaver nudicaule]
MGTKNVKLFIWLGLVVALLLVSFEVSAVKDLAEKTQVGITEKNGAKDHIYGVSSVTCFTGCCRFGSIASNTRYLCVQCC